MTEGKYLSGNDDLRPVYELRREVFWQEMHIAPQEIMDGQDGLAVHGVVYEGQQLVAAGRILFDGDRFKISHVAVREEKRRMGYGDFVVRMLINKALLAGAQEIYGDTLTTGEKMYENIGFETYGEAFKKEGVCYIPMRLKKDRLRKCCSCGKNYN